MPQSDIDTLLISTLSQLSPLQTRKALRAVANFLRRKNVSNIQQQKNADGSAYSPRKNKNKTGKMLTGFSKHIKKRTSDTQTEVGIFGKAANLAVIHDQGRTQRNIKYPTRNLLGFSDDIKQGIQDILLKHINAHP